MSSIKTDDATVPGLLLVDDEAAVLRFLRTVLSTGEYRLYQAETGRAALTAAATLRPDLILLDLGLPDLDGVEVIKRVREWSQVPIVVLSVREGEDDKVQAFEAGADDYLTKPFGARELFARIKVALRRTRQEAAEPVYRTGELCVDLVRRRVTVNREEVHLSPTEYELLRLLVTHAGKVLTHSQILKHIWGVTYVEQQNVLRVNIRNLRQKIEDDPSRPHYLTTEPGIGYRLRGE